MHIYETKNVRIRNSLIRRNELLVAKELHVHHRLHVLIELVDERNTWKNSLDSYMCILSINMKKKG